MQPLQVDVRCLYIVMAGHLEVRHGVVAEVEFRTALLRCFALQALQQGHRLIRRMEQFQRRLPVLSCAGMREIDDGAAGLSVDCGMR